MNRELSAFQDLTLDFIGGEEMLVLVPKKGPINQDLTDPNIPLGSAIIAKKITNPEDILSPVAEPSEGGSHENLDSQSYLIYYEGYPKGQPTPKSFSSGLQKALNRANKLSPTKQNLILSKGTLTQLFYIVGILDSAKLSNYTNRTNLGTQNQYNQYIDLFPEYKDVYLQWVDPQ
jgi:hypothetical protein